MSRDPIRFKPAEVSAYYRERLPNLKQRGREWRGPCPVHQGKRASFSVQAATGLACCHSECARGWDIIALEEVLTGADFGAAKTQVIRIAGRPVPNGHRGGGKWQEIAQYPYHDEEGRVLFEVVRRERGQGPNREKDFKQRRPDGRGGWIWDLAGVRRVPYRLPKVLSAETVYLPEGEKDVHILEAGGLVASCNPCGAGSSHLYADWLEYFRGRHIVIFFDNDKAGREHAVAVAAVLLPAAASIRIVELPGLRETGDVSDWLNADGTFEKLSELTEASAILDAAALSELRKRWGINGGTPTGTGGKQKPVKSKPESSPFLLTDDAVLYIDSNPDKEALTICGRLEVAAVTRNANGDGWGRLLK